MKTPKRTYKCKDCRYFLRYGKKCEVMGEAPDYHRAPDAEICPAFLHEKRDAETRWKRKNCEKQLKRTIERLQEALAKSESEKRRTHARLYGKYVSLATKHEYLCRIMQGAEMNLQGLWNKGTYGHDIEGS